MLKKLILIFVALSILFFSFQKVHAGVIINEVQLSPTEERFIELYNEDAEGVDLSGWYMQRKTATGSSFGSLVSKPNFEGKTIGARSYFVISRSSFPNSDIVLSALTLTESNTIQIKKSEEEVIDKIGWGDSAECGGPCPENPPEGKSIQKIGGNWVVEAPTRGSVNSVAASPSSSSSSDASSVSNGGSAETSTKPAENYKIKTKITAKNISFAGLPLTFKASASGYNGENLIYGKFFVNFGDGDSKEIKVYDGENFSHTYFYPGDYIVSLEYFLNSYGTIPDASHQIAIKIVKPDIIISAVGDEKDFFVELTNNTDYEADISNWILSCAATSFTFPRNTVIGSKKKMTISSSLTNFSFGDKETLKLMTPQWKIIHDFTALSVPPKEMVKPVVKANQDAVKEAGFSQMENQQGESLLEKDLEKIPFENVGAAAIKSEVIEKSSYGSFIFTISAFMFVGASAGAVYFIRRKRAIPPGSDFNILDE